MNIEKTHKGWRIVGGRQRRVIPLEQLAYENGFRVRPVAESIGCCERHLYLLFARDIGMSPKEWMRQQRIVAARRLLSSGVSVGSVGRMLGFSHGNNFTREFRTWYGLTPLRFCAELFGTCPTRQVPEAEALNRRAGGGPLGSYRRRRDEPLQILS